MLSGIWEKGSGCRGNSYYPGTAQGMEALVFCFVLFHFVFATQGYPVKEDRTGVTFQNIII